MFIIKMLLWTSKKVDHNFMTNYFIRRDEGEKWMVLRTEVGEARQVRTKVGTPSITSIEGSSQLFLGPFYASQVKNTSAGGI